MTSLSKIKVLFVSAFAVLLLLPLFQMATGVFPKRPLLEYRKLAEFPEEFHWGLDGYKDSRVKFEEWFNDNMGLRGLLIRLHNEIPFRLLKWAELVYVGDDDWFFQKIFYDGAWGMSLPSQDEYYDKAFQRWVRLRDLLADRGITLVVFDIPLKHHIYPEFLPSSAPTIVSPSRFDRFRKFLDENGIPRVDVGKALREGKGQYRVYRKQDLHWTIQGGYIGGKALLDKIATLELGHSIPWGFDFVFTKGQLVNVGSESRALPLLNDLTEYWGETDPDGREGVPYLAVSDTNPWDRVYLEEGDNLLPPIVVLNDSFFENMERCGLSHHFKALHTGRTLMHEPDRSGINAVLKAMPEGTKYLVMEFMENNIDYVLPERAQLEHWPEPSHPEAAEGAGTSGAMAQGD